MTLSRSRADYPISAGKAAAQTGYLRSRFRAVCDVQAIRENKGFSRLKWNSIGSPTTVADVASNAIRCDVRCGMQGKGTVSAGSATLVPVAA